MKKSIDSTISRMKAAKPEIMKRQMDLPKKSYDLSDLQAKGVAMTRGKPVQEGVRVRYRRARRGRS